MIIRADSELGALLTLLVLFGGFVGIISFVVLLLSRKFLAAAKVLLVVNIWQTVTSIGMMVRIPFRTVPSKTAKSRGTDGYRHQEGYR